jgi:hypothetical protein
MKGDHALECHGWLHLRWAAVAAMVPKTEAARASATHQLLAVVKFHEVRIVP